MSATAGEDGTVDGHAPEGAGTGAPVAERLPLPHAGGRAAEPWRRRALALRGSLPQLARNPVVVSASTVAVTLAARVALEVARRALAGPGARGPVQVEVSGHVVHHVHVVQHLHVVHHASSPIGWPALSAPPRR
ncbi:hypothetical protein [Kineococcus sp. SYSU DK005]|uniref:hypothetical protein n=1 Tax=Kineococcus sp. SYSU DK005 TaxID=3383126 RepID=UPI003D7C541D